MINVPKVGGAQVNKKGNESAKNKETVGGSHRIVQHQNTTKVGGCIDLSEAAPKILELVTSMQS